MTILYEAATQLPAANSLWVEVGVRDDAQMSWQRVWTQAGVKDLDSHFTFLSVSGPRDMAVSVPLSGAYEGHP